MNTTKGSGANRRVAIDENGSIGQLTVAVSVPRDLIRPAALMATRFEIEPEAFIRFHITEGAISTLGIASSNVGWTPEDYPFESREKALRAASVVLKEYPGSESHQISYLKKGKMVYEEVYREELGLGTVSSPVASRKDRKSEVSHA